MDEEELPALQRLAENARACGVDDLQPLDAAQLRQREPALRGVAALHSPSTGIFDSHAYLQSLLAHAERQGAQLILHTRATHLEPYAGELAAARTRVPAALAELARLLRAKGLEVVGTELDREAQFADGLSVLGRLDLVVRHPTEGLGVIDLKWTKSAKRRRTELAEGRALQLATYGAIADPGAATPAPGAYYLLNQRRLIGPVGAIVSDEEVEAARSLADTWNDLMGTWRLWRDLAAKGAALGTGLPEASDHFPEALGIIPGQEPCQYCELTSLCRVTQEAN